MAGGVNVAELLILSWNITKIKAEKKTSGDEIYELNYTPQPVKQCVLTRCRRKNTIIHASSL